MQAAAQREGYFRFGIFELSESTGSLFRNGIPVRLPPQAAQLLLLLVKHGGEVVTREQIQQLTWSDHTVVDFEVGINRCIRRIRAALLDDADAPRYLETVPRVGYRFIAPVEHPASAEPIAVKQVLTPAFPELPILASSPPPKPPVRWMPVARVLTAIFAILSGVVYWFAGQEKQPRDLRLIPLAISLGDQFSPSFSPDGRQVAFVWNGEGRDNFDIYLKLVNSSSLPLRLTSHKDIDYSPAWSPDGQWIAFCRGSDTPGGSVWIVPALGGAARKLLDLNERGSPSNRALAWSPDSTRLVTAAQFPGEAHKKLHLVDVNTGVSSIMTSPLRSEEDMHPAVSADGKAVAFTRDVGRGVSQIMVVAIGGGLPYAIAAQPRHVYNARPSWTPDSSHLVFVSHAGGESHVWLSHVGSSRPPSELGALGDGVQDVVVSSTGQLGLVSETEDSNLWMLNVADLTKHLPSLPQRLLASRRTEESPSIRADGRQMVFASNRSGFGEIWTARTDGSDIMQVTDLQNPVTGSPDWSPDGRHIVFDSRVGGHPQLYITSADGGKAQVVDLGDRASVVPRWSRDGSQIYFASDRTGRMEIWRVGAGGGTPVQITRDGGFAPVLSPAGDVLYYTSDNAPVSALWKLNIASGERKLLAPHVLRRSYAPAANGVYFFSGSISEERSSLFWLDALSPRGKQLFTTLRHIGNGVTLSSDGRSFFFTQLDVSERQLLLVQNFWK